MYYGELIDEVIELRSKVDHLFIYGAGLRGKEVCHILRRNGIEVDGFVVTDAKNEKETLGLPVKNVIEVLNDDVGLIIGLGDIYTNEVYAYLKSIQADFNLVIDGGKYISIDRGSKDLQNNPTVEVTTVIGCKINCKYCPQSVLLNRYYNDNPDRIRVLSIEDYRKVIDNTPDDCDFMFAGMAEPYLNTNCTKMLQMGIEAGRKVSLYTTLEGITDEDIDTILALPFQFVGLHVADKEGCAKITVSDKYYGRVERLINATKPNGEPFINDISAQGEPFPKIRELCEGKYEVLISLQDRAGNLKDDSLAGRKEPLTTQRMTCCFSGPKFNNHVLLPDGTLLLCNMDYGMKHVLGNLFENSLDEIRQDVEMRRVFKAVSGDQCLDVLCRKCLFAMVKEEENVGNE